MRRSARRIGAPLGKKKDTTEIYLDEFPLTLKEKLEARGFTGTRRIRFDDVPHPNQMHVGRVHPIVSTLAETLSESALDPQTSDLSSPLGRAGVWKTSHVDVMTTVLLLRLRFKLITSGRTKSLLLAEEATGLAFPALNTSEKSVGADALALLEAEATEEIEGRVRERRFNEAFARLESYQDSIAAFAHARAEALSEDHLRLTGASRGGATVQVEPNLPADVLGLYVFIARGRVMALNSRKQSDIGFSAVSVVGGLISPDKIAQIASTSPDAKTAESYSCPKGTNLRDEIARYFRIGQAEWQGVFANRKSRV